MDKLLNNLSPNSTISIIGETSQILQIILKRNTSVTLNKNHISYTSSTELEEKAYHELNYIKGLKSNNIKILELIQLKNTKDSIEYISLTNRGRIIKIIPMLYNNLSVRLSSVLLFSESINLVEDEDIKRNLEIIQRNHFNNILFGQHKYYLIKSNNPVSFHNEVNILDLRMINEFLYLSSDKPIIEKRLGDSESIIIKINGLLAFEKSITFAMIKRADYIKSYLSPQEDVIVYGPGLVIFEAINTVLHPKQKHNIFFWIFLVVMLLFSYVEPLNLF